MPKDNGVGLERLDVESGIAQGFAFDERGAGCVDRNDFGTESFGRDFEGGTCARARLEEQINNGASA